MKHRVMMVIIILVLLISIFSGCISDSGNKGGFLTTDGTTVNFDRDEIREVVPMGDNTIIKLKDNSNYTLVGKYRLVKDSVGAIQLWKIK